VSRKTCIAIINPITETRLEAWTRLELEQVKPRDVRLHVVAIAEGPCSIKSRADDCRAVSGLIARQGMAGPV